MSIDVTGIDVLSLADATKLVPARDGKRVSVCTLWRWCRKGLKGVHLEYVRVGRGIYTSREALNRFFEELARSDRPLPTRPVPDLPELNRKQTPRALRELSLRMADAAMERLGVKRQAPPAVPSE